MEYLLPKFFITLVFGRNANTNRETQLYILINYLLFKFCQTIDIFITTIINMLQVQQFM